MDTAYRDRADAGEAVARQLGHLANRPEVIALGLVRGGVPVAARVAARLAAPFDVLVIRKLGVPAAPEVAFGAIGPGGVRVLNDQIADRLDPEQMAQVIEAESAELVRREQLYRAGRPPLDLTERTVVLVDDGLATGATARASISVTRRLGARRVVMAVPVGASEAIATVEAYVDELICPLRPTDFGAVGQYYLDFRQVSDDEVSDVLAGVR